MNILLVDDDSESRHNVAIFLDELGHKVVETGNGDEALEKYAHEHFHIIFSDIRMPGISGLDLIKKVKKTEKGRDTEIVIITGYGDMTTSIEALRAGAYDYLLKPINIDELVKVIDRIGEHTALLKENEILTKKFDDAVKAATNETRQQLTKLQKAYCDLMGLGDIGIFSLKLHEIFEHSQKLHEDRSIPVLIEGETGTGKEVIARFIHLGRDGYASPFVDLNCAAMAQNIFESELFGYEAGSFTGGLPRGQKGKLDAAFGGTLFLDEVADMSLELQAKLLRVIQEKEYYRVGGLKKIKTDVRIICATNVDVEKRVSEGLFRQDLYYRLNVGRIRIPPLRERTEEILPLAKVFLEEFSQKRKKRFKSISDEASAIFLSHNWPGNIRELKNVVEWIVFMFDEEIVRPEHMNIIKGPSDRPKKEKETPDIFVPEEFMLPKDNFNIDEFMNTIIKKALKMHKGNKSETARYLGVTRRSLYCRLRNIEGVDTE